MYKLKQVDNFKDWCLSVNKKNQLFPHSITIFKYLDSANSVSSLCPLKLLNITFNMEYADIHTFAKIKRSFIQPK